MKNSTKFLALSLCLSALMHGGDDDNSGQKVDAIALAEDKEVDFSKKIDISVVDQQWQEVVCFLSDLQEQAHEIKRINQKKADARRKKIEWIAQNWWGSNHKNNADSCQWPDQQSGPVESGEYIMVDLKPIDPCEWPSKDQKPQPTARNMPSGSSCDLCE